MPNYTLGSEVFHDENEGLLKVSRGREAECEIKELPIFRWRRLLRRGHGWLIRTEREQ
jgi:hypothetical protein